MLYKQISAGGIEADISTYRSGYQHISRVFSRLIGFVAHSVEVSAIWRPGQFPHLVVAKFFCLRL